MDQEIRIKASKSLEFLRSHPAMNPDDISSDSLFAGLWMHMASVCKRGKSEDCKRSGVYLYEGDEHADRFKDVFEEEYKNDPDAIGMRIEVPYEDVYGEPWEFSHVEYWYEITFFVFNGNPYEKGYLNDNNKKWARYGGPHGGCNSFEEMIIEVEEKVKEIYGDFSEYNHFYTDAEKKNHKTEKCFFFSPCEDHKGYSNLDINDRHVDISDGLVNLRWLKWFMATDYAKENWSFEFDIWNKLIYDMENNEPEERKKLLAE